MRVLAVVLAALISTGSLAGCITTLPSKEGTDTTTGGNPLAPAFSLSRVIEITIDKAALDRSRTMPGHELDAFVKGALVVRMEKGVASAAHTVLSYTDKTGAVRERPLSDFGHVALVPGTTIRVEDAALGTSAVLKTNGTELARRDRPADPWWSSGPVPFGFRMEPGAGLAWETTSSLAEGIVLRDIRGKQQPFVLERLEAKIGGEGKGTLDLRYDATTSVKSGKTVRGLAYEATGRMTFPILLDGAARNTSSGERATAGLELAPAFGGDHRGRIYFEGLTPVRYEGDGGKGYSNATAYAWLSGALGTEATKFSCFGKAKTDRCVPSEIPLHEFRKSGTVAPYAQDIPPATSPVQGRILDLLASFLAEDLRPGDAILARIEGTSQELGSPAPFKRVLATLEIRATGYEKAQVRAGTFDTVKIVEKARTRLEVPKAGDATSEFVLDETLVEATYWLMKDSFVPVRIDRTMPFNAGKVVGDAIASVPAATWKEMPFERLVRDSVNITVEAKAGFELTRYDGKSRMSPWGALALFGSSGALAPMLGALEDLAKVTRHLPKAPGGTGHCEAGTAGCGDPRVDTGAVDTDAVYVDNNIFRPGTIRVPAGTTVKWTWRHGVHSVTPNEPAKWGGSSGSGIIGTPNTFTFKFDTPGTYHYHCIPHAFRGTSGNDYVGMVGTVVVT